MSGSRLPYGRINLSRPIASPVTNRGSPWPGKVHVQQDQHFDQDKGHVQWVVATSGGPVFRGRSSPSRSTRPARVRTLHRDRAAIAILVCAATAVPASQAFATSLGPAKPSPDR